MYSRSNNWESSPTEPRPDRDWGERVVQRSSAPPEFARNQDWLTGGLYARSALSSPSWTRTAGRLENRGSSTRGVASGGDWSVCGLEMEVRGTVNALSVHGLLSLGLVLGNPSNLAGDLAQ